MLLSEIKNIKSGKKELKEFGVVIGIAFTILSVLFWWQKKNFCTWTGIISVLFLISGFLLPTLLLPIHKVWMTIALLIGFVMTRIILFILFYFVLTPISLVSRLFGTQYLDLKLEKDKSSYWIFKNQGEHNKDLYDKQF